MASLTISGTLHHNKHNYPITNRRLAIHNLAFNQVLPCTPPHCYSSNSPSPGCNCSLVSLTPVFVFLKKRKEWKDCRKRRLQAENGDRRCLPAPVSWSSKDGSLMYVPMQTPTRRLPPSLSLILPMSVSPSHISHCLQSVFILLRVSDHPCHSL